MTTYHTNDRGQEINPENALPKDMDTLQRYEFIRLKLMEECSEVIHATCKLGRYGFYRTNPNTGRTNAQDLICECGDAIAMIRVAMRMLGMTDADIMELVRVSTEKLQRDYPEVFLHPVEPSGAAGAGNV